MIEVIADATGEANPSVDSGAEDAMTLIDRLAIDAHEHDNDAQVTMAYDSGIGYRFIVFRRTLFCSCGTVRMDQGGATGI